MLEILTILGLIGLDQLTKYLTDLYLMPLGTSVPLIEGIFHFTSAHNTGAAFSILAGNRFFLLALASIAAAVMLVFLFKKRSMLHFLTRLCLALIIGGAIGNIIDRAMFGYVRDMLEFRFINFAIFNVADCGVSIGAALLALDILFGKGKHYFDEKPKEAAKKEDAPEKDPMGAPDQQKNASEPS